MALFELTKLASFLQRDLDEATAQLAHDLTLDAFQGEVGVGVITPTPQPGIMTLAIQVAARVVANPVGVQFEATGPLSRSGLKPPKLSEEEVAELRRLLGKKPRGRARARSVNLKLARDWAGY